MGAAMAGEWWGRKLLLDVGTPQEFLDPAPTLIKPEEGEHRGGGSTSHGVCLAALRQRLGLTPAQAGPGYCSFPKVRSGLGR